MQQRALAVHDISCVGRCSLTVALPILSAAGINTAIVPTALLSTHTGEFTGYTHLDLSDQLTPIAHHLATLDLHFDAFYSGYLASAAQVERVLQMLEWLCDSDSHIFVDPAFADHGKLYSLMDGGMPEQMRRLCARAKTIVPNLTEACFLLGRPLPEAGYDAACIGEIAQDLARLGPKNVVITDVTFDPALTGVAVYQSGMGATRFFFRTRYDGVFHGTGDVFASFLLSALLAGMPLCEAVELALDMTHLSIRYTLEEGTQLRFGVQFERVLPAFMHALEKKPASGR